MRTDYYIAINGKQQGPFTLEEIKSKSLSPDTMVWKTGLPKWIKASEMPEIWEVEESFEVPPSMEKEAPDFEDAVWFAMVDNNSRRVGPHTLTELMEMGLTENTPVWTYEMADWAPASTRPEIMERLRNKRFRENRYGPRDERQPENPFANNPYYGNNQGYGQTPPYQQNPPSGQNPRFDQNPHYGRDNRYNQGHQYGREPYNRNPYGGSSMRTNWLPWAIGATVTGFFFSCIGVIFGIIGIVQANKANNCYSVGDDRQGDSANSMAKTMTIIGYVLAGIGLIVTFSLTGSLGGLNYW